MKKIIMAFSLLCLLGYAQAQTDTDRVKFTYYPDANVYYNNLAKTYWYRDSVSNKWQTTNQLPVNYAVDSTKGTNFYYNGSEAWKSNTEHKRKYGSKVKPKKEN